MGAETRIKVKVVRTNPSVEEVIVSAVTLEEAKQEAAKLPNVIAVLDAEYDY